MMTVELLYFTDPASGRCWGAEPALRRLLWEFGGEISPRWVMGGLARTLEPADHRALLAEWLELAAETEMPFDPRLWLVNPISSTYPACQAVRAACEQGPDLGYSYLRRLREGLLCERRRLDHAEALIAEAGPAGLDRARFEIDLRSHAITEAFGADLEATRGADGGALELPSAILAGEDGERHELRGPAPYEPLREAAIAAGAEPGAEGRPEPLEAIERFGRCATRELVELSGRPRPVIEAELWALAREWRLRPVKVLTGELWELA